VPKYKIRNIKKHSWQNAEKICAELHWCAEMFGFVLAAPCLLLLLNFSSGIGSLFDKIGCDRAILNDLLGSSEQVKDDNMMQYLGLIEQRANELLAAQSFLDSEVKLFCLVVNIL